MPSNIDQMKNNLPPNTIGYYSGVNLPVMYHENNRFRRFGNKLLYGVGTLAGLYGAYKLGQHVNKGLSSTTYKTRNNRTRSGT